MIPISFDEQNVVIAEHQKGYMPLPAHSYKDFHGTIMTCWEGTWRERFVFLFTGKIWVSYLTFSNLITPLKIEIKYPFGEK